MAAGTSAGTSATRGLAAEAVGPVRVVAFGTSIVAPAASVVTALVLVLAFAGFASPLVVVITFAASLCCALSIAEFARRVPSAGWAYTYNSRGLGGAGGFLTGWMMVFGYALYVPAAIGLTSAFLSQLLASTLHVTIVGWLLFLVIVAAMALVAYLGIRTSAAFDVILVAGEMAVIAALAITILIKAGPAHFSAAAFSPASAPNHRLTDITDAMIYGITAFAGFEAAAALGEEAKDTRRSVPASMVAIVVVSGVFYLLVICAEVFAVGRAGIAGFLQRGSQLGYLASRYWSPSVLWIVDLVVVLAGLGFVVAAVNAGTRVLFAMGRDRALPPALSRLSARRTPVAAIGCLTVLALALGLPLTAAYGGVRTFGYLGGAAGLATVLVYTAVNISVIRAFRTEFRGEFSFWRHLLIPAVAILVFLFPLWGIFFPGPYTLTNVLPFIALGWLLIGAVAAAILRRRPEPAVLSVQER
jgi:amino acid transporter